jgi:ubiquinone/menaquinone biosynthesis C-methylase UbiE
MTHTANVEQYELWNGDAGRRWAQQAARRDHVLAPVASALFEAARIRDGESVLDIACGCGATTLRAARDAGPTGSALGIDISQPMLGVARGRAGEQGVPNVSFEQADAQVHALDAAAYDIAISRFGTMFFADPRAAFANIARASRDRARLCLVTWQPLAANDWLTIPGAALLRYATAPEQAPGPGMFAQSDPIAVCDTLASAGYDAIRSIPVTVSLTVGADAADAASYLTASGPGRILLDTMPENERLAAMETLESALGQHAGADGVRLDAAIWVTTAFLMRP